MRLLATMLAVIAVATACSSDDTSADGVEAVDVDGVWVFQHAPDVSMEALHSGVPVIVNDCLVIDNTIVVWAEGRFDEARAAVTAARNGSTETLLIGGGGISLAEGGSASSIPDAIAELCPTEAVWFGAP